jgi:hypothetical protein
VNSVGHQCRASNRLVALLERARLGLGGHTRLAAPHAACCMLLPRILHALATCPGTSRAQGTLQVGLIKQVHGVRCHFTALGLACHLFSSLTVVLGTIKRLRYSGTLDACGAKSTSWLGVFFSVVWPYRSFGGGVTKPNNFSSGSRTTMTDTPLTVRAKIFTDTVLL